MSTKSRPMMMTMRISFLLLFALSVPLGAQTGGGSGLEVPVVELVYERPVVLPPSRKGEVLDTLFYQPISDESMIFGQRISNLYGDGGPLPIEGEFDDPLVLNVEASLGTYISPLGRISAEYARERWNVRGLVALGSTGGHVDGAEGRGLRIEAGGEYQIQGRLPSPGKARIGGALLYRGDDYSLYGRSTGSLDRRRSLVDVDIDLTSETDLSFDYALMLGIEGVDIDDDSVGFARNAAAFSPEFGGRFRIGDDSLNVAASLRYRNTSLDYVTPSDDVGFLEAAGRGEWGAAKGLFVTLGAIAASGGYSDGDTTVGTSATLIMPRASARYEISRSLAIYGRFAPELRAPSYRARMMRAPYVDANMPLRPEKLPLALAAGLRIGTGETDLELEGAFETTENSPVVTLGDAAGILEYTHRDASILRLQGSFRTRMNDDLTVNGRITVEKATDDVTDRQLPMRPILSARAIAIWDFTERLTLDADILFEGEQNVTFDATTLPTGVTDGTLGSRFLLGVGGTYALTSGFDLFARLSNGIGQIYESWQGYEAPGIEVRGGVRGRL